METNGPILTSNQPSVRKHRKQGWTTHFKQMGHPTILKKKWYFWVDMGKDTVLRLFNAFFRGKILIFGHFTGQSLVCDISEKRPWAYKRWVTLLSWKKWYFGANMGWIRVVRLFHDILKRNYWFWDILQAKMNKINQEKQLFYFHLFPLKGVVHS